MLVVMSAPVSTAPSSQPVPLRRSTRIWAAALLLLSFALCLLWSHAKRFRGDELLQFNSDDKPVSAIMEGQLHHPFSLEPPAYHLLLHGLQEAFPHHLEFATRLPSLLGFLAVQIFAFGITRRLTRSQFAALLAMIFPLLLITVDYAVEARVYSLLAAVATGGTYFYQRSILEQGRQRILALTGLFLMLAAGILLHYYAIFFPLPILAGELARTSKRRRIDWGVWIAVALAYSTFAFDLPFTHALAELRAHYYDQSSWSMIPFTYLWMLGAHYGTYIYAASGAAVQFALTSAALVGTLVLVLVLSVRWASERNVGRFAVRVVLFCSVLLPMLNVAVAHLVTHAYSPRYSLPSTASASILLALLMEPWLQSRAARATVAGVLLLSSVNYIVHHIRLEQRLTIESRADSTISPLLAALIQRSPDHCVYTQDDARFMAVHYYLKPEDRGSLVLLYSVERELFWRNRDASSLYARNMGITKSLPVEPFEALRDKPGPHLLVIYDDPAEEWINVDLPAGAVSMKPMGKAFGGALYEVVFRPGPLPGQSVR